jgi:adenylate kinase family enzyme
MRIIITGDAGRGKTTFARNLAKKLGIKQYSTDDFYFLRKFTVERPKPEALKMIKEVYRGKDWIVEGTTKLLLEPGLKKADVVYFLRHRFFFMQAYIILRRGLSRKQERLQDTFKLLWDLLCKRYSIFHRRGVIKTLDFVRARSNSVKMLYTWRDIEEVLG